MLEFAGSWPVDKVNDLLFIFAVVWTPWVSCEALVLVVPVCNPFSVCCFPADCGDGEDHGFQSGQSTGQVPQWAGDPAQQSTGELC